MAHELGHLLLPAGSHSSAGLMQAAWTLDTMKTADRLPWTFTHVQAEGIHERLNRRGPRALTGVAIGEASR